MELNSRPGLICHEVDDCGVSLPSSRDDDVLVLKYHAARALQGGGNGECAIVVSFDLLNSDVSQHLCCI